MALLQELETEIVHAAVRIPDRLYYLLFTAPVEKENPMSNTDELIANNKA
jgi:hypothetical protein